MSGRLRVFLTRVSHYFVGNGLAVFSGVISYPILTRALGPEAYGIMGLISSVLLGTVALGKLGVQNAIVRQHAEARQQGKLATLASTLMAFGLAAGATAALAQAGVSLALGGLGVIQVPLVVLLILTAPLVLVRTCHSFSMSFIRAEESTRLYNVIDVLLRYLSLGLALLFVFFIIGGVEGFYTGILCAEAVMVGVALWHARKLTGFSFSERPDRATLSAALAFGLPLLAFELTNVLLAFGDRVLIKVLLSDEALGHYTAAYNLGNTLQSFILLPLALAIQPMYMRIWAEEGAAATAQFLERAGALFILMAIPSIAGVAAVREPLVELLAGELYMAGADVLPLTFAGFVLYGGYAVFAAGLFLHKETARMAVAVGAACALNLGLNALLIPPLGIMGAAVATLCSYTLAIVVLTWMAFKRLRFGLPWGAMARVSLMSAVMFAAVRWIELGEPWWTLLARVPVGAAVMAVMVGADRRSLELIRDILRQRSGGERKAE